jgi:hypothetical protein
MSFLSWLFRRAPRIEDPLPPLAPIDFAGIRPVLPLEDPVEEVSVRPQSPPVLVVQEAGSDDDEPLDNLFCEIEYEDSQGTLTRRPVTFMTLSRKHAYPCIVAVCHLRRALRTFRADRIRAIITADGEVFDGQSFLVQVMKLDLRAKGPGASPMGQSQPQFRRMIAAPLAILVSCGKADGHFHVDEVDRVMSWAEREAMHLHRAGLIEADLTLEEADTLGRSIAMLRPQAKTLQRHMMTTILAATDRRARFRRALQTVIEADGVLHDAELDLLADFDRIVAKADRDPAGFLDDVMRAGAG